MRKWLLLAGCGCLACPVFGALSVQITAPLSSAPLVGVPITFTATAADTNAGAITYRYSVAQNAGASQILVDYNSYNTFIWAPSQQEGSYTVAVSARNLSSGETASSQIQFTVQPQAANGEPVITPTANPLVALYSAPPCPVGSSITVYFGTSGSFNHTDQRFCNGTYSNNFYIAGMLPGTTYEMHYTLKNDMLRNALPPLSHRDSVARSGVSPTLQFTTGAIPAGLTFPSFNLITPPTAPADTDQNVLLIDDLSIESSVSGVYYFPTATDLNGQVLWYYSALGIPAQAGAYFIRPIAGGTILLIAADPNQPYVNGQILREIDLAGNTVRETNAARVSEQLVSLGLQGITDFDHDAIRLPNGHTLVICGQERVFPAGTQGSAAPIDILGDAIVDLDTNLQVAWSWSAYDHLDVNRAAILGETCGPNQGGCTPVSLAPVAADWLHSNSLNYIPASGDLLLSVRHQDWVVKIDYDNGTGTGDVVWELGKDGSFSIVSNDPYPWFSHQHDVEYELNWSSILSLFDNGNTRSAQNPGIVENSRGMVLQLDESSLTATPLLSTDLGVYSAAVGSAQRLDNGDYHFEAGFIGGGAASQNSEFSLAGVETYLSQINDFCYRSYRMVSLYELDGPGN